MFRFMRTIIFYTLWSLNFICEGDMSLLPTILTLEYFYIFIFSPWTVTMKLPMLKYQLIRFLVLFPLWTSYILSYIMAMSDFGDILINLGLKAMVILLNIWLFLMIVSTMSAVKGVLVFLRKYGISMILR